MSDPPRGPLGEACDPQPAASQPAAARSPAGKCVILVPVGGHIEPACEKGLTALEQAGYPVRRIYGHSDIARGRSVIATQALADGFDELLWIDSDVVFQPRDVERLRGHRLPLVGGIYPLKGKRRLAMTLLDRGQALVFGKGGGLIELKYLATGFLLTHRSVYEKVRVHHRLPLCRGETPVGIVPYFLSVILEDEGQNNYLSEDFSFCWRARTAGFKVMADTTIRLGHVGSYTYMWEDAGREMKRDDSFRIRFDRPIERSSK